MCFNNGGHDVIKTGVGDSPNEAMSDAIQQATGYKVLWGTAPSGESVPSPAAPNAVGESTQGRTFEDMHREAGSPAAGVVAPPPATVPLTTPAPNADEFVHTGDHDGPANRGPSGERNVLKENDFTGDIHDVEADNRAQQERNQAEADQQNGQSTDWHTARTEDPANQPEKTQAELDAEEEQRKADLEQKDTEEEAHPHRKGKRKH